MKKNMIKFGAFDNGHEDDNNREGNYCLSRSGSKQGNPSRLCGAGGQGLESSRQIVRGDYPLLTARVGRQLGDCTKKPRIGRSYIKREHGTGKGEWHCQLDSIQKASVLMCGSEKRGKR